MPGNELMISFLSPCLCLCLCVCVCFSGWDLQGRFPRRAWGKGEAAPEEGGAAGSADSGPGWDRQAQTGGNVTVKHHPNQREFISSTERDVPIFIANTISLYTQKCGTKLMQLSCRSAQSTGQVATSESAFAILCINEPFWRKSQRIGHLTLYAPQSRSTVALSLIAESLSLPSISIANVMLCQHLEATFVDLSRSLRTRLSRVVEKAP